MLKRFPRWAGRFGMYEVVAGALQRNKVLKKQWLPKYWSGYLKNTRILALQLPTVLVENLGCLLHLQSVLHIGPWQGQAHNMQPCHLCDSVCFKCLGHVPICTATGRRWLPFRCQRQCCWSVQHQPCRCRMSHQAVQQSRYIFRRCCKGQDVEYKTESSNRRVCSKGGTFKSPLGHCQLKCNAGQPAIQRGRQRCQSCQAVRYPHQLASNILWRQLFRGCTLLCRRRFLIKSNWRQVAVLGRKDAPDNWTNCTMFPHFCSKAEHICDIWVVVSVGTTVQPPKCFQRR